MTDRDTLILASDSGDEYSRPNTMSLFLALFLLVLAFFIVLLSISTLEEVKSKAVQNSLTSTFKTVVSPSTDPTEFTSKDGDVLAGQQFQEQITDLFATTLQIAKIEVVQPGRLMRIKLPTNTMFIDDQSTVRSVAVPAVDRIVAVLSSRPPGVRFDMEFVIGSAFASGNSLPVGQTLEFQRIGNLAREMFRRGVPPDIVSIGIKPGRSDEVAFWFFVRRESEGRLCFDVLEDVNGST